MILFLVFIIVPIVEIAILIQVGGLIGGWETVAIVILTAMAGTALFRTQGFRVLARAEETLSKGAFPAEELFDGICILVAGILLLPPGFVTDAMGLALLVPGLRGLIGRFVWQAITRSGHTHVYGQWSGPTSGQPHQADHPHDDDAIEGQFHEVPPVHPEIHKRKPGDET